MPDIRVIPESTLVGVMPVTEAAREWIEENAQAESWQWLGDILWVEARYALPLLRGAHDAGLEVA
jgi:hypothetical protein